MKLNRAMIGLAGLAATALLAVIWGGACAPRFVTTTTTINR